MGAWQKRIELLANIAIIVVAILLGAVLVNNFLLAPKQSNQSQTAKIKPGTKLMLPGVEWGKSRRTLLMALSTTCRYCTESAPFYRRLVEEKAKHSDVGLLAVLPQKIEDSQKYLADLGVNVDVKQAPLNSIGASGTPMLILADEKGDVINSWLGKLPPDAEAEVLKTIQP